MIKLSYDKYDKMVEKLEKMDYQCRNEGSYWPSIADLQEKCVVRTKTDIEFLQWLIDSNDPPETEEEKKSQKYILKLLYENLELTDE